MIKFSAPCITLGKRSVDRFINMVADNQKLKDAQITKIKKARVIFTEWMWQDYQRRPAEKESKEIERVFEELMEDDGSGPNETGDDFSDAETKINRIEREHSEAERSS